MGFSEEEKQRAYKIKKELNLHFVGKDKFYFEEDKKENDFNAKLDKAIDKFITKKALSLDNFNMELPKLSEFERIQLRAEILKALLKEKGATDEEIEQLEKEAKETADILAEEHKEHCKGFNVVEKTEQEGANKP